VPNPLLADSSLPYALPDFDQIEPHHYEEAIRADIAQSKAELAELTGNPEPPTVTNLLEPLERLRWRAYQAAAPFHQMLWANGTPEIEEINLRIAPIIESAEDDLLMNKALHAKLSELAETAADESPETRFLISNWLKQMRRRGVLLDDSAQARLREIGGEITELEAKFGQLLLAGNKAAAIHVTEKSQLAGLDDDALAAYASAAADQGLPGWLISLELTTSQQILSRLQNPELRSRIMAAAQARGIGDDAHDTRTIISQIARLRAERAILLGYPNYAAFVADENVIGTADAVAQLLDQLASPAMRNVRRETDQLAQLIGNSATGLSDGKAEVAASDWAYLAEQLRKEKYHFDFDQLRPYLELTAVLEDGVFKAAHELYGMSFVKRPDLSGYHPDVVVYEVFDSGPQIPNQGRGLVMFDFYARPTKRGGAWMSPIVQQSRLLGQNPVITQTLNLVKPAAGEPTLITWDNVRTLFHEFGHALHGLLSDAYYPSQSGVNVPTDFVEYPSQVNEMWASDPEILASYARHYQTGEPIPAEWQEHLKDRGEFGAGFYLAEILGANAIDQAWHRLSPAQVPTATEVIDFEKEALRKAGVFFPAVPPRYRSSYYNHIWGSGYAAGYYSYLLSKMYDADTVTWFAENGGLKRENGNKFRTEVLARGNTRDPKESFRALRGRDVVIEPLLDRLGLTQ